MKLEVENDDLKASCTRLPLGDQLCEGGELDAYRATIGILLAAFLGLASLAGR